jgi:hypothetical protein
MGKFTFAALALASSLVVFQPGCGSGGAGPGNAGNAGAGGSGTAGGGTPGGGGGGGSTGQAGSTGLGGNPAATSGAGGAGTGVGGGGGAAAGSRGGGGAGGASGDAGAGGHGGGVGGAGGVAGTDTWDSYAKGFFQTFCVSCHNDDHTGVATRDYHVMANVVNEKAKIACGVSKSQADWSKRGCTGFPPAHQFPVGGGPKPTDAERDRVILWIDSGTP